MPEYLNKAKIPTMILNHIINLSSKSPRAILSNIFFIKNDAKNSSIIQITSLGQNLDLRKIPLIKYQKPDSSTYKISCCGSSRKKIR